MLKAFCTAAFTAPEEEQKTTAGSKQGLPAFGAVLRSPAFPRGVLCLLLTSAHVALGMRMGSPQELWLWGDFDLY